MSFIMYWRAGKQETAGWAKAAKAIMGALLVIGGVLVIGIHMRFPCGRQFRAIDRTPCVARDNRHLIHELMPAGAARRVA
jgi:hypothetical protein